MSATLRAAIRFSEGGSRPRHVALAVGLGLAAGLLWGWNLLALGILVVAVALAAHLRTLLVTLLVGRLAGWLLIPLAYRWGVLLLDHTPLGRLLGSLGNSLLVVLLDLDRYVTTGYAMLALLLAPAGAWLALRLLRKFEALEASPLLADDEHLARRVSLGRSLLGTPAAWTVRDTSPAMADTPQRPLPWLRPGWQVAIGVVLAAEVMLAAVALPRKLQHAVLEQVTLVNGATADAGRIHVSLESGRIQIDNLHLADPLDLARDRLRIGSLRARLREPAEALRGWVHLEEVELRDLRGGQARYHLADRVGAPPQTPTSATPALTVRVDADHFQVPLDQVVSQGPYWTNRLGDVSALLAELEQVVQRTHRAPPRSWAAMVAARSDLGSTHPRLIVDRLTAESLNDLAGLSRGARLEMTALSNHPAALGFPTTIHCLDPAENLRFVAKLNLHAPALVHQVEFEWRDLRLLDLVERPHSGNRLAIRRGRADLRGSGHFDQHQMDLSVQATVRDMEALIVGTEPLMEVAPDEWNAALVRITDTQIPLRITDAWKRPLVVLDSHGLQSALSKQLRRAGHVQIAERLLPPTESELASVTANPQLAEEATLGEEDIAQSPAAWPLAATDPEAEIGPIRETEAPEPSVVPDREPLVGDRYRDRYAAPAGAVAAGAVATQEQLTDETPPLSVPVRPHPPVATQGGLAPTASQSPQQAVVGRPTNVRVNRLRQPALPGESFPGETATAAPAGQPPLFEDAPGGPPARYPGQTPEVDPFPVPGEVPPGYTPAPPTTGPRYPHSPQHPGTAPPTSPRPPQANHAPDEDPPTTPRVAVFGPTPYVEAVELDDLVPELPPLDPTTEYLPFARPQVTYQDPVSQTSTRRVQDWLPSFLRNKPHAPANQSAGRYPPSTATMAPAYPAAGYPAEVAPQITAAPPVARAAQPTAEPLESLAAATGLPAEAPTEEPAAEGSTLSNWSRGIWQKIRTAWTGDGPELQ